MGEFELIESIFVGRARAQPLSPTVTLGIGDDCALLATPAGQQVALSCDMLVEGQHFFPDVDPVSLGHKALAVNLSDLAAMGAKPQAFTLALSLPKYLATQTSWLDRFASGLMQTAKRFDCPLIGGDTTSGPLNLCITILGLIPMGQALQRNGAQIGDDIWVSGTLGDARLALQALRNEIELPQNAFNFARSKLERPTPRIALGMALRNIASSCIDISDGLIGDLKHVLNASGVGAIVDVDTVADLLKTQVPLTTAQRYELTLSGGDDYELLFTAPSSRVAAVLNAACSSATPVTRIGTITEKAQQVCLHDRNHQEIQSNQQPGIVSEFAGFDHFADSHHRFVDRA